MCLRLCDSVNSLQLCPSDSFPKTLIALGSPFPRWELDPFYTQNRSVPGCIASTEHRLRFHWNMHADEALHTHSLETIIDRNISFFIDEKFEGKLQTELKFETISFYYIALYLLDEKIFSILISIKIKFEK